MVSVSATTVHAKDNANELKSAIHPIFGWNQWRNELPGQIHLIPVLQLATSILLSPASLSFIYFLINAEPHTPMGCENKGTEDESYHCHFRKSTAPDKLVEKVVLSALQGLTKYSTFELKSQLGTGCHSSENTLALTSVDRKHDVIKSCKTFIKPKGVRDTMLEFRKEGTTIRRSTAQINRARFVLATTFCHEVIHAIDGTVPEKCNDRSDNPVHHYYEGQIENEIGYVWEMEVFGAIRIGCELTEDVVQCLPSLDQSLEELDFDGEQHTCFRVPTTSIVGFMNRIQRPEFWEIKTPTMLRLPTKPKPSQTGKSVSSSGQRQQVMARKEPMCRKSRAAYERQVLKARAKRDDYLKDALAAKLSGRVSQEQLDYLQVQTDCLVTRKEKAALIALIFKREVVGQSRDLSAGKKEELHLGLNDSKRHQVCNDEDEDTVDEPDVDESNEEEEDQDQSKMVEMDEYGIVKDGFEVDEVSNDEDEHDEYLPRYSYRR
ncbi:MAG: hypothetical protein Q9169_005355 [Polycauliona sp. 2 TL-2023]